MKLQLKILLILMLALTLTASFAFADIATQQVSIDNNVIGGNFYQQCNSGGWGRPNGAYTNSHNTFTIEVYSSKAYSSAMLEFKGHFDAGQTDESMTAIVNGVSRSYTEHGDQSGWDIFSVGSFPIKQGNNIIILRGKYWKDYQQCTSSQASGSIHFENSGWVRVKGASTPTPTKKACGDGIDNDGDGKTDFPNDPGCDSATDNDEYNAAITCSTNTACGSPTVTQFCSVLTHTTQTITPTCMNPGTSQSYCVINVHNNQNICNSMCTSNGGCDATECSDGIDNDQNGLIDYPADPGCSSLHDNNEYSTPIPITYQCNDGIDNDWDGFTDYPQDIGCNSATDNNEYNAPIPLAQCQDGVDNDWDGFTDYPNDPGCSSPTDNNEYNAPTPVYQCSDGIDNDWDGKVDYPADPGCTSDTDNNEYNAPTVHQCSDGLDNDGDNYVDYPNDPDCTSPTDDTENNFNPGNTQCSDGLDNDGDNLIDMYDPDCSSPTDDTENNFNPGNTQCSDGLDNDYDGYIDYPNDPSCTSLLDNTENQFDPGNTQCSDSIDNDNDGLVDYPSDPGCTSITDNDEYNAPIVYECSDGLDNDGDDLTDYPHDPSCTSPTDNTEDSFDLGYTQCSDGKDNDADNFIDMEDADCESPMDDTENHFTPGRTECTDGLDNDGDGLTDMEDADCNAADHHGIENQFNSHVHDNYDVQKEHIKLVTYDNDPVTGDEVYFQLDNDGNFDIEKIVITAYIPELAEWDRMGPIDLDEGDIFNGGFNLHLDDAPSGFYDMRLSLTGQGSDGSYTKARWVEIYVTN